MAASTGDRAGSRRGPRRRTRPTRAVLLHAVGITALVVAWGYLVWAAIDFGTEARQGEQVAWVFLGLASLGAVACLFAGLMLVVRLLQMLGVPAPIDDSVDHAPPPTPRGGKRAAR